jgi:hypothetical protein
LNFALQQRLELPTIPPEGPPAGVQAVVRPALRPDPEVMAMLVMQRLAANELCLEKARAVL